MRNAFHTMSLLMLLLFPEPARSAETPTNPAELGLVTWQRELTPALAQSAESDKPVLLLFQEIPGCQGCQEFGSEPLSHPLLVEAIEDEFIPVAIYNNRGGYDETIRTRYDEPAWNFPVMRFLDAEGKDMLPRRDRIWTTHEVAVRLMEALDAAKRDIPGYLALVAQETSPTMRETVTFSMHCFWEGEGRLGGLDGVIDTRAGWQDGREVVEVTYDAKTITLESLIDHARKSGCADSLYVQSQELYDAATKTIGNDVTHTSKRPKDAKPSDQKHTLQFSKLKSLPLTPMQATKINAALHRRRDAESLLSPRQAELLRRIEKVLIRDPDRLNELSRPGSVEELPAYERKLRAVLNEAELEA